MKYISLDIETTCLGPANADNILQVSMIVEDSSYLLPINELPHLTFFIKYEQVTGSPFALAMNSWILDIISGRVENHTTYPIYNKKEWVPKVIQFLDKHFEPNKKRVNVAGKNVSGFDIPFFPDVIRKRFRHRCIDPGSVYVDWKLDALPGLDQVKEMAGMENTVTHDAYEDALDVIKVLRRTY